MWGCEWCLPWSLFKAVNREQLSTAIEPRSDRMRFKLEQIMHNWNKGEEKCDSPMHGRITISFFDYLSLSVSLSLSVCLSLFLSLCLSLSPPPSVCLSLCLCLSLSSSLSLCLPLAVCLAVCFSLCLCLSLSPSVCLSLCLCLFLSLRRLSVDHPDAVLERFELGELSPQNKHGRLMKIVITTICHSCRLNNLRHQKSETEWLLAKMCILCPC